MGASPEDRPATGRTFGRVVLNGRTPWGRAVALDPGVTTDKVLVILVEFSPDDFTSPDFPGEVFPGGPLHGQIPAPAPGDKATYWPGPGDKGFGTRHFQQMLFGSAFPIYDAQGRLRGTCTDTMTDYFLEMSKGSYKLEGDIADWVRVPRPEAWYGRDADSGGAASAGLDSHAGGPWALVEDALTAFKAANPGFDWAAYDRKNPFGIAGSDPDVPDGYVDHLILVHAGMDQAAGGGAQGSDAIWAHSSWVDVTGGAGPAGAGGVQVDAATSAARPQGVWAGPYTINPEDGGIGVFSHEFAHDLGLPDEYDTSRLADSPSAYWTLMANGSWSGKKWGEMTRPSPMNAWDKEALGWITPRTVALGQSAKLRLQPAATGAARDVAVRVELPDKTRTIVLSGADDSHDPEFWSGMGDGLSSSWIVWDAATGAPLEVAVPKAGGTLTFDAWYEIEDGFDYGFVEVSTDAGATWNALAGDHTVLAADGVPALSGASGGHAAGDGDPTWEAETYALDAFAGQTLRVRFRYATDGGLSYRGWEVTNVTLPGAGGAVSFGGADTGFLDPASAWTQVSGVTEKTSARYYIAEYRDYSGFDGTLAAIDPRKPYLSTAEFFPYSPGLHLIYRDTFYHDNRVGEHPGEGGWMVVDAHPVPDMLGGDPWSTLVQVRDAAFGTSRTPGLSLMPAANAPEKVWVPGRAAQPTFDDSLTWWYRWAPAAGVKVDELGVRMTVKSQDRTGLTLSVHGADASTSE